MENMFFFLNKHQRFFHGRYGNYMENIWKICICFLINIKDFSMEDMKIIWKLDEISCMKLDINVI